MKKMVVQYEFRGTCHTCQAFMNFVVYDSIEYREDFVLHQINVRLIFIF